ncbi:hypothetical protein AAC387_Pa07g1370 [Persea americana]
MSILHSSDLQRVFSTIDRNGDGHVSVDELSQLLSRLGVSTSLDELEEIAGGTRLNLQEFISFYESIYTRDDGDDGENDLVEAFRVFDLNGDGFISCGELHSVLSRLGMWVENEGDCARMIGEFDTNLDGQIDLKEFKNMMLRCMR